MSRRSGSGPLQSITGQRLRVRRACEPCKNRKKRCNGALPCSTCLRFEYNCSYTSNISHSSQPASTDGISPTFVDVLDQPAPKSGRRIGVDQVREANSSKALIRQLEDSSKPGQNDNGSLAFNLASPETGPTVWNQITNLVTHEQMQIMSDTFFTTVHRVYGFLQRSVFDQAVSTRWSTERVCRHEVIFCYVAALGSLFATGRLDSGYQQSLVHCANSLLEHQITVDMPNATHVAALVLKTMILRCTAPPHAAWLTSCMAVHTMETIDNNESYDARSIIDIDNTRCIVRLQNFWISNETGNPHVGGLDPSLSGTEYDKTRGSPIFELFHISLVLEPDNDYVVDDFRSAILKSAAIDCQEDAFRLSQTNLALVLHRRLKALDSIPHPETTKLILSMITTGLEAASRLAKARQPWWHVANVPFQCLCTLLIMDNHEALSLVSVALSSLQAITEAFPLASVNAAYDTACKLVARAVQKKEQDADLLKRAFESSQSLNGFSSNMSPGWSFGDGVGESWLMPDIDAQMDQYINLNWFPSITTDQMEMQTDFGHLPP